MKMSQITEEACKEAAIYRDAGIVSYSVWMPFKSEVFPGNTMTCKPLFQDGLIIENMHDIPYSFSVGPEVCACMTAVCTAVRSVCPSMPLGVQILSSANQQALAIALASGSVFTPITFLSTCKSDLRSVSHIWHYSVAVCSQVWISSGLRVLSFLTWRTRASWTPAPETYWDIVSRLELSMCRSSPTSKRSTGEIVICTV